MSTKNAPRNHVVLAALKRQSGAGAHRKSRKALRAAEKRAHRAELRRLPA